MPCATKEEQREYQRRWLAARREAWLAGKVCAKCGSTDRLEIDHIDPDTKNPVLREGTRIWSWRKERRDAELAKCQILCFDCHAEKTKLSLRSDAPHGTYQRYSRKNGGCRCDACKAASAEYKRGRRNKLGQHEVVQRPL